MDGPAAAAGMDLGKLGGAGALAAAPFRSAVASFHLTNPIARASVTMAECAALAASSKIAAE